MNKEEVLDKLQKLLEDSSRDFDEALREVRATFSGDLEKINSSLSDKDTKIKDLETKVSKAFEQYDAHIKSIVAQTSKELSSSISKIGKELGISIKDLESNFLGNLQKGKTENGLLLDKATRSIRGELKSEISGLESKMVDVLVQFKAEYDKIMEDAKKDFSKSIEDTRNLLEKKIQYSTIKTNGASMPRDWKEDSSTLGTLQGALNATNMVFTLSSRARPNTLNVFYNGVRQNSGQYTTFPSVGWIQSWTFSSIQPISTDTVEAFYST